MESTAPSMVPWAVMMMTGRPGARALMRRRVSMPSMPGICRSSSTRSTGDSSSLRRQASPLEAWVTAYWREVLRMSCTSSRVWRSSSTTMMRALVMTLPPWQEAG